MAIAPRLAEIEFADNPEPRCACVLLLDTSSSMKGERLQALNEGLQTFRDSLLADSLAARRVEIAVLSFDSEVKVWQDFVTVEQFEPPTLTAQGLTFMGSGIEAALDLIQVRKQEYKQYGVDYYRPWIFMITDGAPQGEPDYVVQQAAQRVQEEENNRRVIVFAVGVEGADMVRLRQIVVREPARLSGLKFTELFVWLSASMQAVSHSNIGTQIQLPSLIGWSEI